MFASIWRFRSALGRIYISAERKGCWFSFLKRRAAYLFISCCRLDLRAKREENKMCRFGWWTPFKTILLWPAVSLALQPVLSVWMEGDCFSSGLWGQGDGEMINESQKCCSRWTVNATGLRTRSENVTLRYMQAVCPKAESSSPALSQPESSRRSWWSCSRYFMACQKRPCEKRHTDLSSSLFQLFAHLCPWKQSPERCHILFWACSNRFTSSGPLGNLSDVCHWSWRCKLAATEKILVFLRLKVMFCQPWLQL